MVDGFSTTALHEERKQQKKIHKNFSYLCPQKCFVLLFFVKLWLFHLLIELPGPPTNLAVSNIGPRSVTLLFKPGYDGKTSISRWLVEAQVSLN